MARDVSKKIVLVMLVIAIVLSVSGTWLVLENVDAVKSRTINLDTVNSGNVNLEISTGSPPPDSLDSGNIGVVVQ